MDVVYRAYSRERVPAYREGAEPVQYGFRVDGVGTVLAYNFTDVELAPGEPVILVLDIFQRWVYSKQGQSLVMCAEAGEVKEPVLSSPYREFSPNFLPTDATGRLLPKDLRDKAPRYLHHLSSGLVRLFEKPYAPLRATYAGGEDYVDTSGEPRSHTRGELRADREKRPVYLLARDVDYDEQLYAVHADFLLKQDVEGTNSYLNDLRSDSPFQGLYVDGRECNFDIKPIPQAGAFPEEWELTTDWSQAQVGWDIALAPGSADGEVFVKGEQYAFARRVAYVRQPKWDAVSGRTLISMAEEARYLWEKTGEGLEPPVVDDSEERWYETVGYTYWELQVPDGYAEPVRGQGVTEDYCFREIGEWITPADIGEVDADPGVRAYTRLKLADGAGVPEFHDETVVCRSCEYAPSRGVFLKVDEDNVRYPLLTTPDTSEGYGLPVARSHKALNETTKQCTVIVEHPRYNLTRAGHELMLSAENECWRQCDKIESVKAPGLGDPRAVPRQIIYVVRTMD